MQIRSSVDSTHSTLKEFQGAMHVVPCTGGFWEGRQWRAYFDFAVTSSANYYFRIVATKPFLLQYQNLFSDAGAVRASIHVNRTVSGGAVWTTHPIFGKHTINGPGSFATTIDKLTTGTLSAGTEREVLRTGGNASPSGPCWLASSTSRHLLHNHQRSRRSPKFGERPVRN